MTSRRPQGFSLLEIMVATALIAIALTAVMSAQGNTFLASRRAELVTTATMLARQKIVEVEIEIQKDMRRNEFPDEKSEGGKFEEPYDDFRWEWSVERVELPAPVVGDEASVQSFIGKQLTEEISKSVRKLKLTVLWKEGEGDEEESLSVVTHMVKL
ncbi:MAG: hypothetical protein A3I05_05385 [Deltaproteobacteria bacterium RIFCSPLOWO2_02_FULL_44_10]|nr:MAG: hypothetical protein A3C46_06140 [Deltaproteobacteria bacterium RIFCSPHIGHO2_02_FULL_44_16]OGQ46020.1 MAG: hypothetical protein A3I05_05385 [Deltaproteobacteria bacterium RIFCSPLOWO2_02_FULL_44_10]